MVKPVVSAMSAWSCIVISLFAIVILSIIGALFKTNHPTMVGSEDDPENGPAVAVSVFGAVGVYVVFLVFCASQAFLHARQRNRGAISLQ